MLVVASAGLVLAGAHPFLAKNGRVGGQYLVIEGWVPNYALEEGIRVFRAGGYEGVLTVGCQTLNGVNLEPGDNDAQHAAARLRWLGLDPKSTRAIPAQGTYRNRTYLSAVALREWFERENLAVEAIDVVTVGLHARRTHLLFERAFGGKVAVGVIVVTDREYDPSRWWQYSEGVREMISEGVAYLYARLLFWPKPGEPVHTARHQVSGLRE